MDACQDMAIQMDASEVVPVFLHALRVAGRVRQLHPREFDGDVQELRDCLQHQMLADVFPVTELIRGLGRLTSSMQGEPHHQLPVAPPSLSEFSEELMKLLAQKPELMHKTSPIVFEQVVGAMFKRFNMDVAFTQQTCDGGYDIVAIEESRHTRNQYIIEVKRFHPTRKVGVALVQRLYGVKTANSATKAFLVTSSSFSAQARKWARQHAWELDLKDYGDLVKWLKLHWGNG